MLNIIAAAHFILVMPEATMPLTSRAGLSTRQKLSSGPVAQMILSSVPRYYIGRSEHHAIPTHARSQHERVMGTKRQTETDVKKVDRGFARFVTSNVAIVHNKAKGCASPVMSLVGPARGTATARLTTARTAKVRRPQNAGSITIVSEQPVRKYEEQAPAVLT